MRVALLWFLPFVLLGIAGAISELFSPVMPDVGPQPLEVLGGSLVCGVIFIGFWAIVISVMGAIDSRKIDKEYHPFAWDWHDAEDAVYGRQERSGSPTTSMVVSASPRIGKFKRVINPDNPFQSFDVCSCRRARSNRYGISLQTFVEIGDRSNVWKCDWCGRKHS